jgi:cytochrome b
VRPTARPAIGRQIKEILVRTAFESRSEAVEFMTGESPGAERQRQSVLVWDWPVRVLHWTMVICFAGAWLSAESERWRMVHVTLGYTMAGLVGFRLVWGLFGTRYARFAQFVRGPLAVWQYLRGLLAGRRAAPVGHNPVGALAIVGMLLLTALVTATGWAVFEDWGPHGLDDLHEGVAQALLVLVLVHVLGVVMSSSLHQDNLVAAMLTGRKKAFLRDAISSSRPGVALMLIAAVSGFWIWQALGPRLG